MAGGCKGTNRSIRNGRGIREAPTSGTSGRSRRTGIPAPFRYVSSRSGEALHPGRDVGGRRLRGLRRAVGEAGGEGASLASL